MLAYLNSIAKNYEYLIKAVGAFLPFIITLFMAYIAYQQWQTNEKKRQQDLFELRYNNLYANIRKIANEVKGAIYRKTHLDLYNFLTEETLEPLVKNGFLIKEEDFIDIMYCYSSILECFRFKQDDIFTKETTDYIDKKLEKVNSIMKPYLQIEKTNDNLTIWNLAYHLVQKIYKLLFPSCIRLKIKQIFTFKNEIKKVKKNEK